MIRSPHIAILLALTLFMSPVLACCDALHDMMQSEVTELVDKQPCHGEDSGNEMPAQELCMGCPGCELALTGSEIPALVLTFSKHESPALLSRTVHTDTDGAWAKSPPSTGPPDDPLSPAETLFRQHQLLLL